MTIAGLLFERRADGQTGRVVMKMRAWSSKSSSAFGVMGKDEYESFVE